MSERGLHRKFDVRRTDPLARQRHPNCDYFVLDLDHDEHAIPAIVAYADSVEKEHPALAGDLRRVARNFGSSDQ